MKILNEIYRIKNLMKVNEGKNNNFFKDFDLTIFKNFPPPSDNSEETKKEIKYLKSINLKKRFVQEKDRIDQNFIEFL